MKYKLIAGVVTSALTVGSVTAIQFKGVDMQPHFDKISEAREVMDNATSMIVDLKNKVVTLKEENNSLKNKSNELSKENDLLKENSKKLIKENDKLKEEKQILQEKVNEFKDSTSEENIKEDIETVDKKEVMSEKSTINEAEKVKKAQDEKYE